MVRRSTRTFVLALHASRTVVLDAMTFLCSRTIVLEHNGTRTVVLVPSTLGISTDRVFAQAKMANALCRTSSSPALVQARHEEIIEAFQLTSLVISHAGSIAVPALEVATH